MCSHSFMLGLLAAMLQYVQAANVLQSAVVTRQPADGTTSWTIVFNADIWEATCVELKAVAIDFTVPANDGTTDSITPTAGDCVQNTARTSMTCTLAGGTTGFDANFLAYVQKSNSGTMNVALNTFGKTGGGGNCDAAQGLNAALPVTFLGLNP